MNDKLIASPSIVIDCSKGRIRIHRHTLHYMGDPDYFILLVNPHERTIAILPSDRSDKRAHRVTSVSPDNKQSFELYSRPLTQSFLNMYADWQDWQAYRIYGEIIREQGVAKFHIDEYLPLRESRS